MSFLFPKPPAAVLPPLPPVPPPAPVKAPDKKIEAKTRADLKRRRGSGGTIITGPAGLTAEQDAPTVSTSLLGRSVSNY